MKAQPRTGTALDSAVWWDGRRWHVTGPEVLDRAPGEASPPSSVPALLRRFAELDAAASKDNELPPAS